MTAHQLAKYLMACPDVPVDINGWGSDEGTANEVTGAALLGKDDCLGYPRDESYEGDRLFLGHGGRDYPNDAWRDWVLRAPRLEVSK